MKRIVPLLLMLLLLTSCGAEEQAIISEVNTSTEFSMAYTAFTGTRQATISISDSATATVTGSLTSKSGSLSITIADEEGNVAFEATESTGASSFSVKLTGPANYTIDVTADNHTGSFSFQWEIIGAAVQEASSQAAPADQAPVESEPAEKAPAESSAAPSESPELSSETVEPSASPEATVPTFNVEELDWNGIFTSADGIISLELWQADSTSYEFEFTQDETVLLGVARIDLETMASASCTVNGAVIDFTWTDTQTLEVSTGGTVAALSLDPTGTYVFVEMN